MRKFIAVFVVALLFVCAFLFQSCEKCIKCHYTYTGPQGETLTYDYPELCGNKGDINDLEDLCNSDASAAGGQCSCEDQQLA